MGARPRPGAARESCIRARSPHAKTRSAIHYSAPGHAIRPWTIYMIIVHCMVGIVNDRASDTSYYFAPRASGRGACCGLQDTWLASDIGLGTIPGQGYLHRMTMQLQPQDLFTGPSCDKQECDVLQQSHEGHEHQEDHLCSSLAAGARHETSSAI